MSDFAQLAKQAFENYHGMPIEPGVWGLTDAFQHIVEFLNRHESVSEMPGLTEALQAMSDNEWDSLRERYPEHRRMIDSLRRHSQRAP